MMRRAEYTVNMFIGGHKKTKLQLSEIKTAATEQELKLINKISSKKDTCTDT